MKTIVCLQNGGKVCTSQSGVSLSVSYRYLCPTLLKQL
jgi:hypothetical protein